MVMVVIKEKDPGHITDHTSNDLLPVHITSTGLPTSEILFPYFVEKISVF